MKNFKQLLDEVFVISAIINETLLIEDISQKPNSIIVLLYMVFPNNSHPE
jgi:hypothetical protein